jgi:hypothetical protein
MYRTVTVSVATLAIAVPMLVVASPMAEAGRHSAARHIAAGGAANFKASRPMIVRQQFNRTVQGAARTGSRYPAPNRPSTTVNVPKLAPKLGPAPGPALNQTPTTKSRDAIRQAVNQPTKGAQVPAFVPHTRDGTPANIPGRINSPDKLTMGSAKSPDATKGSVTKMPPPAAAQPKPIPADGVPRPGGPLLGSSGIKNTPAGEQIAPRDVAKDPAAPGLKGAGKGLSGKDAAIGAGIIPSTPKAPPPAPPPAPPGPPLPPVSETPAPLPTPPPSGRPPAIVVVPGIGFGDRQAPAVVEYVPRYAVPRYQAQPRQQLQPAKTKTDEPVCVEGVWAMQDNEKKYVCLSWYFRGRIYTPDQLAQVLAQLQPKAQ